MSETLEREPNATGPTSRWAARLTPARIVAFAVLGSIPVKLLSQRLGDPDLWWHLRTGRLIVQNGFPHTDVFSFTAYGKPWVTQEWAPEVLFHYLREWFGLYGILAYRAIALFIVYAIVARLFVRRMGSGMGTWALLGLAAYGGSANWTERPNLISFILFAITLSLLESKGRRVWWFVAVAAFWANMHGMVLIGLGTVVVVAASESLKVRFRWEGNDRARARRLWLVAGAGVLATFANPEGPGLLLHGFRLIGQVTGLVTEWASPDFHEISALVFLGLLVLTIAAMALNPERPDPTDVALFLAFTVLSLQAVRNLAIGGIVIGLVAARYLPGALATIARRDRPPKQDVGERAQIVFGVLGIVLVLAGFTGVLLRGFPRSDSIYAIVDRTYPVDAIDRLDRPGVCLFTNDFWSGMVIDRDWPNVHVYMDLRQDVYGRAAAEKYMLTISARPDWERNLDEAGVTHVLVRLRDPLAQVLRLDPGWKIEDLTWNSITFARATPGPPCELRTIDAD